MKVSFLMACIIAAGLIRSASSTAATPSFDYSGYAVVLKTYVNSEGMVHYKALKGERQELDSFITSLGRLEASQFNGWSEKEKIAFWINAYNAITLQSIINNYPIKKTFPASLQFPLGIRHIAEVWKEKTHLVMNKKISLDDIEHEKLRKQFNEPRQIHIALACRRQQPRPRRIRADAQAHRPAGSRQDVGDRLHFGWQVVEVAGSNEHATH
jgi:hypothetical protein